MDGAAHTVGQLGVQLGQLVLRVHAGVGDVSHGGRLHDVPDDELLDSLVLGAGLGAITAPNELDMSPSMFITSIITALGCHFWLFVTKVQTSGQPVLLTHSPVSSLSANED